MNVYKLTVNQWGEKPLDKEIFETETGRARPWYVNNESGPPSCFAVCPACDNPIQILGFYHQLKNTDRPYARHYPNTISGLAVYRQEDYEFCPHAAARDCDPQARRHQGDPLSEKILDILVPNFDRVIYILEAVLGFRISDKLAKELLIDYQGQAGHRYLKATLQNIPWIFAYMTLAKSLMGRVITEEPLLAAIREKVPQAVIRPTTRGHQVSWEGSQGYLELTFCLMHHRARQGTDGGLKETMKMVVMHGRKDVYSKTIEFDREWFRALVQLPPEKAKRPRQATLVALAERTIGHRNRCQLD